LRARAWNEFRRVELKWFEELVKVPLEQNKKILRTGDRKRAKDWTFGLLELKTIFAF